MKRLLCFPPVICLAAEVRDLGSGGTGGTQESDGMALLVPQVFCNSSRPLFSLLISMQEL